MLSTFTYTSDIIPVSTDQKMILLKEISNKEEAGSYFFSEDTILLKEVTGTGYLLTIKDSKQGTSWILGEFSKEQEVIGLLLKDVGGSFLKEIFILTKLSEEYTIHSYMFHEYFGYWGKMEVLDDLVNLEIKESKNIELSKIKEKLEALPNLDYLYLSEVQASVKGNYTGLDLINPPVVFSSESFVIKRLKEGVYGKYFEGELYAVFEGYSLPGFPFHIIRDGKYQEGFFIRKYNVSGSYKEGLKEGEWEYYEGTSEITEKYKAGYLEERILYDYDKTTIESYKNGELVREEREDVTGKLIFYSNGVSLKGIEKKRDEGNKYYIDPIDSFWGYRIKEGHYDIVIYDKKKAIEERVDTYEIGREIMSIFYYDVGGSSRNKKVFILTKYEGKNKIFIYDLGFDSDLDVVIFVPPLSKSLSNYFEDFNSLNALTVKKRLKELKRGSNIDLTQVVNFNFLSESEGKFYEGIDFYGGETIFEANGKIIKYYEGEKSKKAIFGEFNNGRLRYAFQGNKILEEPYYLKDGKYESIGGLKSYGYIRKGKYSNGQKYGIWRERGRFEEEEFKELFAQYYIDAPKTSTWVSLDGSGLEERINEYPPNLYYDMNGSYKDGEREGEWKIIDENRNEKIVFYTDGKISKISEEKNEILEVKKEEESKIGIKAVLEGLIGITAFIFSFNFSAFGWLGYFILLPTCWYFYIQYRKKYLYLMIGIYSFMLTIISFYIVSEPTKASKIALLFLLALAVFIPVIMIVNVLWVLYLLIKRLVNRGRVNEFIKKLKKWGAKN